MDDTFVLEKIISDAINGGYKKVTRRDGLFVKQDGERAHVFQIHLKRDREVNLNHVAFETVDINHLKKFYKFLDKNYRSYLPYNLGLETIIGIGKGFVVVVITYIFGSLLHEYMYNRLMSFHFFLNNEAITTTLGIIGMLIQYGLSCMLLPIAPLVGGISGWYSYKNATKKFIQNENEGQKLLMGKSGIERFYTTIAR